LRERNDPQTSDIMRTIDDHTIENFIDRFKGCAMSLDAIIHNMGSTLTPSDSNKCIGNLITVPSEESVAAENFARPGDAEVFQFTASYYDDDSNGYDQQFPDEESVDSLHYSQSGMSMSSGSSPSRYKKISKPSGSSPKKKLGMGSIGVGKKDSLEILVNPRPIVSRGAGFYATNPKAAHSYAEMTERMYQGSRSGIMLGVGFPMDDSLSRPASADSQKLVHHVKLQLMAEGKLQSSQPDKILTDEELQTLATNNKSFDSIADSISSSKSSSYRVAKPPRDLGKVVIGSRKPPIALKTTHADMISGPYDTPVPFKRPPKYGPGSNALKKPIKKCPAATPPLSAGEKVRPLSSTNYGGLYVISSYKDEHPMHKAFPIPPVAGIPPPE
jgi:hypothetical protein